MSAGKWLDEAFKNVNALIGARDQHIADLTARLASAEQRLEGTPCQNEVTAAHSRIDATNTKVADLNERHERLVSRVAQLERASRPPWSGRTFFEQMTMSAEPPEWKLPNLEVAVVHAPWSAPKIAIRRLKPTDGGSGITLTYADAVELLKQLHTKMVIP